MKGFNYTELLEEVKNFEGIYVPVKAGLPERLLKRSAKLSSLHPNPEDEFCDPSIGPNQGIIHGYQNSFMRKAKGSLDEEIERITVEKVRPDGYLILNGHHRWAGAYNAGYKRLPIEIVNLASDLDIKNMIESSSHDKRAAFDLEEAIFLKGSKEAVEKPPKFPYNLLYKKKIRLGIPALFRFLTGLGYDIWVYTANYYSMDDISRLFKGYSVPVTGIVNGTQRRARSKSGSNESLKKLFDGKYKETIHIDSNSVIITKTGEEEFQEYEIKAEGSEWSKEVIRILREKKG